VKGNHRGSRIELTRVAKRFGSLEVLRGLDLEAAPGELLAIVGQSGCGKSTLLRLLSGLDTPTAGTVRIDGVIPSGPNSSVRVMFQDARLLPWYSVGDNVTLGSARSTRQAALETLDQVGLTGRADDWPAVLSGGQKQRVALARALAANPELLLLDEPLGSLDALTRLDMQRLIERVWLERRFTAVLITHDVEEAVTLADRVLVLESGRIDLCVSVPLPRPRTRTPAFAALAARLLDRLLTAGSA
jgi:sulfonate transport system ATP-binding protein